MQILRANRNEKNSTEAVKYWKIMIDTVIKLCGPCLPEVKEAAGKDMEILIT